MGNVLSNFCFEEKQTEDETNSAKKKPNTGNTSPHSSQEEAVLWSSSDDEIMPHVEQVLNNAHRQSKMREQNKFREQIKTIQNMKEDIISKGSSESWNHSNESKTESSEEEQIRESGISKNREENVIHFKESPLQIGESESDATHLEKYAEDFPVQNQIALKIRKLQESFTKSDKDENEKDENLFEPSDLKDFIRKPVPNLFQNHSLYGPPKLEAICELSEASSLKSTPNSKMVVSDLQSESPNKNNLHNLPHKVGYKTSKSNLQLTHFRGYSKTGTAELFNEDSDDFLENNESSDLDIKRESILGFNDKSVESGGFLLIVKKSVTDIEDSETEQELSSINSGVKSQMDYRFGDRAHVMARRISDSAVRQGLTRIKYQKKIDDNAQIPKNLRELRQNARQSAKFEISSIISQIKR